MLPFQGGKLRCGPETCLQVVRGRWDWGSVSGGESRHVMGAFRCPRGDVAELGLCHPDSPEAKILCLP